MAERQCAVKGCEAEGYGHQCPYDGRHHHHGRIHYPGETGYPTMKFRQDAWHLMCQKHYAEILVIEAAHIAHLKARQDRLDD